MKYERYEVHHYTTRADGRVEPAGVETLVLTEREAEELSHMAILVTRSRSVLHKGRHMQPDMHLNWY